MMTPEQYTSHRAKIAAEGKLEHDYLVATGQRKGAVADREQAIADFKAAQEAAQQSQ